MYSCAKFSPQNDKMSMTFVVLLIFNALFVVSHVIYALGFRAMVVLPISTVMLFALNRKLSMRLIFLVLIALITVSPYALWWNSWKIYIYPANIGIMLLLTSVASDRELDKAVYVGSIILLVMLLGAWVAFFLQLSGVGPVTFFTTSKGHNIPFYYTSLAFPIWTPFGLDMLRLNGIYDEPGTFSFVICLFAFFRHTRDMNKKLTWVLLLLGFVTFSVAHFIYCFIYYISDMDYKKKTLKLIFIAILCISMLSQTSFFKYLDYALITRFSIASDEDGFIRGDNRSKGFFENLSYLNDAGLRELLIGYGDPSLHENRMSDVVDDCNPLAPLVLTGIFVSWPYYLFLLFTIYLGMTRRKYLPLLAVGLLFMQRPSVMSSGYAMLAAMVIIIVLRTPGCKHILKKVISHNSINKTDGHRNIPTFPIND